MSHKTSLMKILSLIIEIIKKRENQKYVVIGFFSAISVLVFTWIITEIFRIHHVISVPISVEITIVWGFFALDRWAFNDVLKKHNAINRFVRYNFIALAGLALNESIFVILAEIMKIYYLYSEAIAILLTSSFNFIMTKKIAWVSRKQDF